MAGTSRTRNEEEEENKEQWMVDIETKSRSYDPREYDENKKRRFIYKWPNDHVAASSLSRHRAPRTVSLGPYHHGEEHLQPMEHHKERALLRILHRTNIPLSTFIQSLQDVEQELRDSYANLDPKLAPHLFVRMMLFDGCFLLEILRSFDGSVEPLFRLDERSLLIGIRQDMRILENQIPLLVLEKLLAIEKENTMNIREYLHDLVSRFFGFRFPIQGPCLHILDIYRECFIGDSTARGENETPIPVCSHFEPWLHFAGKGLKRTLIAIPILVFWLLHGGIRKHGHFRTAARLHEAEIRFRKGEPGLVKKSNGNRNANTHKNKEEILTTDLRGSKIESSYIYGCTGLTITFDEKNGVITLPYIQLSDDFPIFYMNLMAFERMHPPLSENQKVTDYLVLMDELIDTAEDVSVLCSQGIVDNLLASDENAAELFNAFSHGLIIGDNNTVGLSKEWQDYAASDWNLALASLRHKYFHNPWSVVPLLAALILLALTIIQTVFSGMQALKDDK